MRKQEQIEAKKLKPIEVGDRVLIEMPYTYEVNETSGRGKNKTTTTKKKDAIWTHGGIVEKLLGDQIEISDSTSTSIPSEINNSGLVSCRYQGYTKIFTINKKFVHPTFFECGANPFAPNKYRIDFYNKDISSLLLIADYGRTNDDFNTPTARLNNTHLGVNFNPYVIDTNGERKYYQRDLVWTLEQKQLLIESIYQGIEIGKFLFRYNSWARAEKERKETGVGYNFDCVDGKQRFFAILHFLQNKYPDLHGNYWDDLNEIAQRKFLSYNNLVFGQMGEDATDSDVIDNFLTLNHAGVPMSQEHIDFVKSINLKK